MNSSNIEKAIAILVEEQDVKHYPVRTMALQRIVSVLETLIHDLREMENNEVSS